MQSPVLIRNPHAQSRDGSNQSRSTTSTSEQQPHQRQQPQHHPQQELVGLSSPSTSRVFASGSRASSQQKPLSVLSRARRLDPHSSTALRCFITGYLAVCNLFGHLVGFLVQLILWALLFPVLLYNPRLKTIMMGKTFLYCGGVSVFWLSPFWRLDVVRKVPPSYHPTDTLVMVNHTSAADPFVTAAALAPWDLKYIYKADLARLPIAGWAAALAGNVPIHFTKGKGGWETRPGSVAAMMKEVKYYQSMGIGQVIFPEGTRSRDGRLQPFKDGFFRYAVENKCEILPCIIHNANKLWPLGSRLLDMGNVYVAFGDPTRPKEGETVEQLKTRVRNAMIELQKLCPLYDPEMEKPLGEEEFTASRGLGFSGCKRD